MNPTAKRNTQRPMTCASTVQGQRLPVIDITDPRFALPADADAITALFASYVADERRRARVPTFITRMILALASRRAPLLRSVVSARSGFLDGLSTYLLKLGPDNLPPPFNSEIDRRFAASPHVVSMRLKLQQVAHLQTRALVSELDADGTAPLHLINLGGGTAIDTLNTLILLNQLRRQALAARNITISVLDIDRDGPQFGAAALRALCAHGSALEGLRVRFVHYPYDWNEPACLAGIVENAIMSGAIVAASSEGGLFEYGTDAAVLANLRALCPRVHGQKIVVTGSVTRDDEARRRSISAHSFALVPRGLAGIEALASRAGFSVERAETTPLSDQVLLLPVDPTAPRLPSCNG
ncbi:hypothetical protein E1N52_40205 [Paraburkholderia guartelaensis]|uniref:Class I SAM-dependent methyltransferase n=1 Tax=Paraburkholderia guartelaensis TaxID=2546446 RepID=A0A4R5L484_9BURK|nr:hypothetical protein [Paraburkholderia guartelaensis]TDG02359.1 hypothetical protein E1N52_40205 [Paraburkholderia guartelaensis]